MSTSSPFQTKIEETQATIIHTLQRKLQEAINLQEKDTNDIKKASGIIIGCVYAFGEGKKLLRIPKKHMRRVAMDKMIRTSIDAVTQDLLIHLEPMQAPLQDPNSVKRPEEKQCQSTTTNAKDVKTSSNPGTQELMTTQKNVQDVEDQENESSKEKSIIKV